MLSLAFLAESGETQSMTNESQKLGYHSTVTCNDDGQLESLYGAAVAHFDGIYSKKKASKKKDLPDSTDQRE